MHSGAGCPRHTSTLPADGRDRARSIGLMTRRRTVLAVSATVVDRGSPSLTVPARVSFAVTALVVFAGLVIQVPVAMDNEEGFFTTPFTRGLNVFTFFTVQSNIIVGLTSAMLALGVATHSTVFRVLRLTGVVGITLTFIVFHLALRRLQDLTGQAAVADFLLHTASPILCVAAWLLFGPRGLTSWRVVALTLVFLLGCVHARPGRDRRLVSVPVHGSGRARLRAGDLEPAADRQHVRRPGRRRPRPRTPAALTDPSTAGSCAQL